MIRPQWIRVRRAHRFFLRSNAPSAPLTDHETQRLDKCEITPDAAEQLMRLLECRGEWQGGVLFGLRTAGTLHVQTALPGGPRAWAPPNDPFALDAGYLLGCSDMAQPAQVDWQGQWLAAPHGALPSLQEATDWAAAGHERGIIDAEHPLICVGWGLDGLEYWSLTWDTLANEARELTTIRCPLPAEVEVADLPNASP